MSLLSSFNLDSFAMPLSFREIKTAAFTVPFLFPPLPPPLPLPVLFSANTRGTKMRTNQYSPTYLVIIICKKRNPWKNGSVPSFHSFPRTRRNLCYDRDRIVSNGLWWVKRKRQQVNLCDFFNRGESSFSREEFACISSPSRQTDSKVSSCCAALLTDLFRFRIFPLPKTKQPELS